MSSSTPSLSDLYRITKKALLAGGAIVRRGFSDKAGIKVSFKTPVSPVTQIDLESEKKIVSIIKSRFPTHTFLAEEMSHLLQVEASAVSSSPYRWIIDPLDGTVNFIHKIPQCGVSVAVEKRGKIIVGGVYDPFRNELFMAVRGKGATLNGRPIRVSREKNLINSLVITGFPYDRNERASQYLSLLLPFLRETADLRRFGAAALDLAWIACGRAEAFLEYKLSPWDVAAGYLIVEEAGGRVTDFSDKPYKVGAPVQTFASNGRIHPAMIRLFNRFFVQVRNNPASQRESSPILKR